MELDADTTASRAYYSAFYAVSAHFAVAGGTFKKYSALEAAIHRDLVKAGVWPAKLGEEISKLSRLRGASDYAALDHATDEEARDAIKSAGSILKAVFETNATLLSPLDEENWL